MTLTAKPKNIESLSVTIVMVGIGLSGFAAMLANIWTGNFTGLNGLVDLMVSPYFFTVSFAVASYLGVISLAIIFSPFSMVLTNMRNIIPIPLLTFGLTDFRSGIFQVSSASVLNGGRKYGHFNTLPHPDDIIARNN